VKRLNLWLGSSILLPLFAASPAQAQRVSADVRIDGRPVAGRLFIGDWREWYRGRPRPVVVVPSRPIYVERIRVPGPDLREEWFKHREHWVKHRDDWFKHRRDWFRQRNEWVNNFQRDARVLMVYYDGRDDCYYDRYRQGLEQVDIYERDGRYYRLDQAPDQWYDYYDRDARSHDDDRYDRYDRDRDGWRR